jgi:hypothetical protein
MINSELGIPSSATLLPSNTTAEVVSVDPEERRFFFLTFFNHQITSRMEFAPDRQMHRIRDLTRNGI